MSTASTIKCKPRNGRAQALTAQARQTAHRAGLRYVNETEAGIERVRHGQGFTYRSSTGKIIRDQRTLDRIRKLAIPPAWERVWICPSPNGHIQAAGYDARGRKQYKYHPRWQEARDGQKYDKMLEFARALPKIRARVERDLRRKGLQREKVLAAVVKLLEGTLIRVGNDEYATQNGSFGLTTLRNRHAKVRGARVQFDFLGKHNIEHGIGIDDSQLARIVRQCQDLPGQQLFEYIDEEGQVRDVGSEDVNEYLREIAGEQFSAKDFRTWAGTVLAAWELRDSEPCKSATAGKRVVNEAISRVAEKLGNTRAICRKCYIHPVVIEAYLEASLNELCASNGKGRERTGLSAQEAAVAALLKRASSPKALRHRLRRAIASKSK